MNNFIILSSFDGDLHTNISDVSYSTSPREIVTIKHAQDFHNRMIELGKED